MPIANDPAEIANIELDQNKSDSSLTISNVQVTYSSKHVSVARQGSKPMSQISGVRRQLSSCDSLPPEVTYLPKYGVKTDRETELGEVFSV